MQIELEVIEGPSSGSRYEFDGYQAFVLGRAVKGDTGFRIPTDPYFSRYHMLFEFVGGQCVLRDMDSRNGVFLNDERIKQAVLADGDIIKAGRSALRVHMRSEPSRVAPIGGVLPRRGDWLGQFQIGARIAEGSQGVVFEAADSVRDRHVALKVLHQTSRPGEKATQYFMREIEVLSALHHPGIVQLLGAGREGDVLWLAMELMDGPNLEELVKLDGPLPVKLARRFGMQLLEALVYAHARGIVHRDLKPANVLLCGSGDDQVAKIADFGLARPCRELGLQPLTATGDVRGTPRFMPPEQLINAKRAGPAADLYSLGASLYWAFTRSWHLEGDPEGELVWQHILHAPRIPLRERAPELPADLLYVVETCLEREPGDRFEGAADALRALLGSGPGTEPATVS